MSRTVMMINDFPTVPTVLDSGLRRAGIGITCFQVGVEVLRWQAGSPTGWLTVRENRLLLAVILVDSGMPREE